MLDFFLIDHNNLLDFVVDSDLLEYVGRLELNEINYLAKFSFVQTAIEANNQAVLAADSYILSVSQLKKMFATAKARIKEIDDASFESEAVNKFLTILENAAQNNTSLRVEVD